MITFDTGVLIALERRKERAIKIYRAAKEKSVIVATPSVVITEWWRGRTDWREKILAGIEVVAVDRALAALAGDALAEVHNATAIDAIVMAFAATTGGVLFTPPTWRIYEPWPRSFLVCACSRFEHATKPS